MTSHRSREGLLNWRCVIIIIIIGRSHYIGPNNSLSLQVVASDETEISNKWCRKTEQDSSLEASSRARATKARLHDLENDMFDRSERQAARDRRLANVRQVLRDSDADDSAFKALSLAEKHVSFWMLILEKIH